MTVLYVLMFGLARALAGCATQSPPLTADQLTAVLSAPDRSNADRENDVRRKAREMMAFIDARPGMRILDVGAGGGYSAELLARVVGASGRVYAHNSPEFMKNLIKERSVLRGLLVIALRPGMRCAPPGLPYCSGENADGISILFS